FLASAWALASLLAMNLLAVCAGWWRFEADGGVLLGVPVDLWLGWALLWGVIPLLALSSAPLWLLALGAVWLDVATMPLGAPVVHLGSSWLVGEVANVALCFVPAQLLGRWTVEERFLPGRVAMQVVLFGSLTLWLLPTAILAQTGGTWDALWQ